MNYIKAQIIEEIRVQFNSQMKQLFFKKKFGSRRTPNY
jgi:hypothetical protein